MSGVKDELKDYINWAVGITLCVSALLFSKQKLMDLFSSSPLHAAFSSALPPCVRVVVVWGGGEMVG